MPFERPFPRPFTVSSIREHAPALPGVFGLSNSREWLYIGEAENIQAALLEHMVSAGSAAPHQQPTGFVFEVCDRARQAVRQASLMHEYKLTGQSQRPSQR
ncbi:hypothetical protein [Paludibaculum fermentans]|uniref:GIY-YIG domain-containing protein n=1 Tax=Paludibaculum fermentans TaxID=1473598 RepID=A0A7S7NM16_PALFE|nr:hypothetical protein [Paludibaculum fermentans]QOY85604.1 hypothetical protein IRI77_22590 [Paludibaculum fermentans]